MSYYPLRALTLDGDRLFNFTLEDGPCPISKDAFILVNVENSPILRYDYIQRGMDISGIYEGDILKIKDRLYTVKYNSGFVAVNGDKRLLINPSMRNAVVSNTAKAKMIPPTLYSRSIYKCDDIIFSFKYIYGSDDSGVWVNVYGGRLFPYCCIKQYAGLSYTNDRKFFGDDVENYGNLQLFNGRCYAGKHDIAVVIKEKNKGEMCKC